MATFRAAGVGSIEHMANVAHRLQYLPRTRRIERAEADLADLQGKVRTIAFEPILRFHMKGLGYFHPTWCRGVWQGEMAIGGEVFDPALERVMADEGLSEALAAWPKY